MWWTQFVTRLTQSLRISGRPKIMAGFAKMTLFLFHSHLQISMCRMRIKFFRLIMPTHVVLLTLFLFGIGYSMGDLLVLCVLFLLSTLHIYLTAALLT